MSCVPIYVLILKKIRPLRFKIMCVDTDRNKSERTAWMAEGDLQAARPSVFYLLAVFSFLFFAPLEGLYAQYSVLRALSWLCLFASVFLLLCFYIVHSARGEGKRLDVVFFLVALICLIFGSFTLVNEGSLFQYMKKVAFILGPWLYLTVFGRYGFKPVLKAMLIGSLIIIGANFITMLIMYPHGGFRPEYGDTWLFGQRTYMRNFIFLALCLCLFYDRVRHRRFSVLTLAVVVASLATLILGDAMTSLVVMVFLLAVLVLSGCGLKCSIILRPIVVVSVALDVLLVHLRQIALFGDFIVGVLDRNLTLSYRTQAWDVAMEEIGTNPLVGTGFRDLEESGITVGFGRQLSNAHNEVLDVCYKGGLLGALSFFALVAVCCLPLLRKSGYWAAFILGAFLGGFFIEALVSDIWYPQFFFLLYFAAYLKHWAPLLEETKRQTPQREA